MLKILNNDKFTTAQNRHSLVSLKIPILNTLPVRAKVKVNRLPILLPLQSVGVFALIPRVLPWAMNWLPFQGAPFRALFVYHVRMLCHLLFGKKNAQRFFWILNTLGFLGGRAFGTGGMSVLAVCQLLESQEVSYFLITPLPN